MEIEFIYLTVAALLVLWTYLYSKRRKPKKKSAGLEQERYETLPSFEATQFFKRESKPESFTLVLDPFASKTLKNGRKFLIFSTNAEGYNLVLVSDAKRHHSSLLRDPRAQGLTPLFAYIVHPVQQKNNRGENAITLPAGKSISNELFEESRKNLIWFTKTILPKKEFLVFLS